MPDLIDVLRADHRKTLDLLDHLLAAPHHNPADQLRFNETTQELVIACSGHEAVEEMGFWPAVRERVPGGEELAEAGIEQETEGKWIVHHLNGRVPGDPEFDSLLAELAAATRAHISYEEHEVWPRFLESVDPPTLEALGAAAVRDRRLAPTRPHPGTPPTPGTLGTLGRLTGVADRAVDVLTGRGHRFATDAEGHQTAEDEPRTGQRDG